jgi:hypothetical protein
MYSDKEISIDGIKWSLLGEGCFKWVYKNMQTHLYLINGCDYGGPWIYQVGQDPFEPETNPERQYNLLKSINPDWQIARYKDGVIAPFFNGQPASDLERALKVIEIYKTTGRILADAQNADNILSNKLKTVCVDVDVALRPDSPVSQKFLRCIPNNDKERWSSALFRSYFDSGSYPETKAILDALCYLEKYFSRDELPVDVITFQRLKQVSRYYRYQIPLTRELLARCNVIGADMMRENAFESPSIPVNDYSPYIRSITS